MDNSIGKPSAEKTFACLSKTVGSGLKILFTARVTSFFSFLALSVKATFLPLKANKPLITFERITLCKSAKASILLFRSSRNNRNNPKKPLCFPFLSNDKKVTFGRSLNNGWKNGLEITVILTFGYFSLKALKTGTVMATSPIAESLMTAICSIGFDNLKCQLFFVLIQNRI